MTEAGSLAAADGLTEDRWLGGRLTLVQPKRGHRVGTDAVLLAAAAGGLEQGRIVDVGAGVGAVGLALAQRSTLAFVNLVEIDPGLARLAERNAALNGLEARTRVLRLDALVPKQRREAGLTEWASCVVTNPPFFDARAVRASPDESKVLAHVFAEAGLAYWIEASIAMLAPRGRFAMIHRPEALRRSSRRSEAGSARWRSCRFIRRRTRARIACWCRASKAPRRRCALRRDSSCMARTAA